MIKEVKTTKRRKSVKVVVSNPLKLRVINLHGYDLQEINRVVLVKKDGSEVEAKFNNVPVVDEPTENDTLCIRLKEQSIYYNKYQLLFNSSDLTTQDFALMYLWSDEKFPNPNYLYEF
jgi:hypothetical protein